MKTSMTLNDSSCIILIGMAGAGKSTLAPLLAQRLDWEHMDTDRLIESWFGRPLQGILDGCGPDKFLKLEEQVVSRLAAARCVVSTGGSVVYSQLAVNRLRMLGSIVHLHISLPTFLDRVGKADDRGFVVRPGLSLEDVYNERQPLYQAAADLTVATDSCAPDECVDQIISGLSL